MLEICSDSLIGILRAPISLYIYICIILYSIYNKKKNIYIYIYIYHPMGLSSGFSPGSSSKATLAGRLLPHSGFYVSGQGCERLVVGICSFCGIREEGELLIFKPYILI